MKTRSTSHVIWLIATTALAVVLAVAVSRSAAAQPAAGSAAPAAGSATAAGSAAPAAGSAAGSAAPAAGSTPAPPPPPPVAAIDCAKIPATTPVITTNGTGFTPAQITIEVGQFIKITTSNGLNVAPNPTDSNAALVVAANATTCFQLNNPGAFKFHSDTKGAKGEIDVKYWYDIEADRPIQDDTGTFWMPRAVNTAADESDLMFYAVLALSAFFFIAITVAVVYLVVKYRHRPGHKSQPSPVHNDALELTWTIIPTIITVFLFWYGWQGYIRVVTPPQKAVEIQVMAMKWSWNFTHSTGVQDTDLHVPVNTPVRLVMTSKDVLHSFYIPVMRVKQDIVPQRYTYAWFQATKPGTYRLDCAEYCGKNHSQMSCLEWETEPDGTFDPKTNAPNMRDVKCLRRAVVVVHTPGDYERYLADKEAASSALPPEQLGKMLYTKKGCIACHSIDGSPSTGPTWLHDFGTMVPLSKPTADGSMQVLMDENYIRESVIYPQAKARPGYPPSMPSFDGQLKEKEFQGLFAFFKSLK